MAGVSTWLGVCCGFEFCDAQLRAAVACACGEVVLNDCRDAKAKTWFQLPSETSQHDAAQHRVVRIRAGMLVTQRHTYSAHPRAPTRFQSLDRKPQVTQHPASHTSVAKATQPQSTPITLEHNNTVLIMNNHSSIKHAVCGSNAGSHSILVYKLPCPLQQPA